MVWILLLSLTITAEAGQSASTSESISAADRQETVSRSRFAQASSPNRPPRDNVSDAEITQALTVVENADGYLELLQAIERYEDVIGSERLVAMADVELQDPALDADRRGLLILERQLSLDSRRQGAQTAARLLAVRLIAGYALLAETPQQFASVLEKFSPLATEMDAQLVQEALDTPHNAWPETLFPLMEQLARDWPEYGTLAAAMRMAEAASVAGTETTDPDRTQGLVGHWRSTAIVFESPRDEHLVLHADGTAETWIVTASDTGPSLSGRWGSQGTTLSVDWGDGTQWSQPFTFHEGQLVFPNIANQRQFWERID